VRELLSARSKFYCADLASATAENRRTLSFCPRFNLFCGDVEGEGVGVSVYRQRNAHAAPKGV
jgi:hypothetical protein